MHEVIKFHKKRMADPIGQPCLGEETEGLQRGLSKMCLQSLRVFAGGFCQYMGRPLARVFWPAGVEVHGVFPKSVLDGETSFRWALFEGVLVSPTPIQQGAWR